jgi:hypothetical protein
LSNFVNGDLDKFFINNIDWEWGRSKLTNRIREVSKIIILRTSPYLKRLKKISFATEKKSVIEIFVMFFFL